MSHPKGMPPRQEGLQVDISKAETIVCENCGNASFIQAYYLKRISAVMSPTGKEAIVPMQVFSCGNCGTIPQNMLEQSGVGQESKIQ